MKRLYLVALIFVIVSLACAAPVATTPGGDVPGGGEPPAPTPALDRESLIPAGQAKITPASDVYPVKSLTDEYDDPIPLPYPVNTAGAEDSAFMTPDGQRLYVWFTPDPSKPVEEQLVDGVTGIYVFDRQGDGWSAARRVWLQEAGKLALDGCEFVLGDKMWFCSAREGYTGLHWFIADYANGRWGDWREAGFPPEYQVGELHITSDGGELYFHSDRPGGQGEYDIWVSQKAGDGWGPPRNIAIVNSPYTDGWPFVSQDGKELWLTRAAGAPELWRSLRVNGEWTAPVKMFSLFSGEASLDDQGNVYFTHHFYKDNVMLEADIYVARRR
jgi:hypothetical protein